MIAAIAAVGLCPGQALSTIPKPIASAHEAVKLAQLSFITADQKVEKVLNQLTIIAARPNPTANELLDGTLEYFRQQNLSEKLWSDELEQANRMLTLIGEDVKNRRNLADALVYQKWITEHQEWIADQDHRRKRLERVSALEKILPKLPGQVQEVLEKDFFQYVAPKKEGEPKSK